MRTFGGFSIGLPDFAFLAEGHQQATEIFGIFENVFHYLLDSGAKLAPGHTMQVGEDLFMRIRTPAASEP